MTTPASPTKVACNSCRAEILPETALTTGGVCMRCARHGPPRSSELVQRAAATRARCVSAVPIVDGSSLVAALEAVGSEWDHVGWVSFQIACPCGTKAVALLGHEAESETCPGVRIFIAPLALSCPSCRRATEIFDPRRDGYNGELGDSAGMTGSGGRVGFACPHCEGRAFEIAVSLAYDEDVSEDMGEAEDFASRPQDFFTWFVVRGRCAGCGRLVPITDYECA